MQSSGSYEGFWGEGAGACHDTSGAPAHPPNTPAHPDGRHIPPDTSAHPAKVWLLTSGGDAAQRGCGARMGNGRVTTRECGGRARRARVDAALAGVVTACAQGWLPLVGLVADGYRGPVDLGPFAAPAWFGTALGLVAGLAVTCAHGGRRPAWRADRRAGIGLACALVGFMLLVATRAAGSWDGGAATFWSALVCVGSALGAAGGALLTGLWLERTPACPADDGRAVLGSLAFGGTLCLLCAVIGFAGSGVWTPCVAAGAVAASYALLEARGATGGTGAAGETDVADLAARPPAGVGTSGAQGTAGMAGSAGAADLAACVPLPARPLAAGALLGISIALMIGQFLGGRHGVASPLTWLFGAGGVVLAALVQLAARRVRGGWDPLSACWSAAAALVVAFYPMEAGSDFSLKFALASATLALWCLASVVPAALAVFARQTGACAAACGLSFAFSFAAGAALAGPAGYAVSFTPAQGMFVLVSAVCAMVVSAAALTLVLGRLPGGTERADAALAGDVSARASAEPAATLDPTAACVRLAAAHGLTPRETEVLQVLARGYDVARVQDELGISEGTALTHKRHIYQKLDVHTRAELLDLVRGA